VPIAKIVDQYERIAGIAEVFSASSAGALAFGGVGLAF
jgi:hypothetical protein